VRSKVPSSCRGSRAAQPLRISCMICRVLLTVIGSAAFALPSVAEELLCTQWENPIAENMRVLETDLSHLSAERSLQFLKSEPPCSNDQRFACLNAAKILRGYSLRQIALAVRTPESTSAFCSWLVEDGFWYD
jgi:hypothetical protein